MSGQESHLTGSYRVRAVRPAFHDAHRLCPRSGDRAELRRQALKLQFWPRQDVADEKGQLLDLDWSWVRGLKGKRVGELRVHDSIGGHDNLRIIFYVGDSNVADPLPMICVLTVLQKKRDDFTRQQLRIFDARRTLVIERFYQ